MPGLRHHGEPSIGRDGFFKTPTRFSKGNESCCDWTYIFFIGLDHALGRTERIGQLSFTSVVRAIEGVAQVEEPGERGGAPGARGGMALEPPTVIGCMNSAAST